MFGTGIFTRLAAIKTDKLRRGEFVADFGVGAPNIPPAPHITAALCKAAADPANYVYAINDLDRLHDAVGVWYQRRYGVTLNPRTDVCALLGSQEGLSHIALTLADPGDTVLVPDPCYPVFADGPRLAGAKLAFMPQRRENGWLIDFDEIDEQTARAARLMVVSYPNNPTTAVADDGFYRRLIDFAGKYDICVLHDNAYSELVFDGRRCGSFLSYPGASEVGVEFNSLSKTYGLAGARIGFCIGNAEVVGRLKTLKSNIDYGMFLPVQEAAIAAVTGDQSCVQTTRAEYENRRNCLCDGLTDLGWQVERCAATMFVWARIPKGFDDCEKFALELVEKTGMIVTPGTAFGASGAGMVRIALVRSETEIADTLKSIAKSGIIKQ